MNLVCRICGFTAEFIHPVALLFNKYNLPVPFFFFFFRYISFLKIVWILNIKDEERNATYKLLKFSKESHLKTR
jgi:hypothetical protein